MQEGIRHISSAWAGLLRRQELGHWVKHHPLGVDSVVGQGSGFFFALPSAGKMTVA